LSRNSLPTLSLITTSGSTGDQDATDRRCIFSRTRERWTLQADCEITAPLDVPAGISLDGHGYVISLSGDAERFGSAAIRAASGEIFDLTVDGSELLDSAPEYFAAIALAAPARFSNVTVRNIQFEHAAHSTIGIEIAAFGFGPTTVQHVTLENISGVGLLLTGDGRISLDHVHSSNVTTAAQVGGTISAALSQALIEGSAVDILAQDQSCVRVSQSVATGMRVAENDALIHDEAVTFIGAGNRSKPRQLAANGRNRPV
jgi:hypothetical protein